MDRTSSVCSSYNLLLFVIKDISRLGGSPTRVLASCHHTYSSARAERSRFNMMTARRWLSWTEGRDGGSQRRWMRRPLRGSPILTSCGDETPKGPVGCVHRRLLVLYVASGSPPRVAPRRLANQLPTPTVGQKLSVWRAPSN